MSVYFNLDSLLQKSADAFNSAIAVEDSNENKITYLELNTASKKISNLLLKNKLGFGNRIGILAPKSSTVITFIFGILKSEAAYVSLDCKAPMRRNNTIYKDCGLQAVFIEKNLLKDFVSELDSKNSYNEIIIDDSFLLLVFNSEEKKHTEQLAYIIYTSGSTGVPKGVKHTHYSAFAFIKWSCNTFFVKQSDKFLSHAPFHFDLSIFDLFVSISVGATLVLMDEKTSTNPLLLAECLSKKQITVFYTTPTVLSFLSAYGKMYKYLYSSLRLVLFAGEVFPINNLKKLKSILPKTQLYNLYGPTETNVCTWFKIPNVIADNKNEPYPIGKTCDFATSAVVKIPGNKSNEGELWVGGDSLMLGYWNDDEKTNSSFEIDCNGELWYRTGDIVTHTTDNNLVYLYRKDRMVKRKGYRIELNEIEKNLAKNKNIFEVAVTTKSISSQAETIITAHVVWVKDVEPATLDLLNYCNGVLPSYMTPDYFKFYESLPKTSTNKINYKALTQLND